MRIKTLLALALALPAASVYAHDPKWIEYGPDGPIARVILTDGGECPPIRIDGREEKMRTRSEPAKNYPVRACEAAIPAGATSVEIQGTALPANKLGRSAKVALLGDTGCRLKAASGQWPAEIQDCSDPNQWPFATVAASIAAWDPDVVLHVGDYYYREAACKGTNCQPATINWARWSADFFTPADPLLLNAPWILTRGNHEDCKRSAEGWFRFLDPRNYVWENQKTCNSNLQFTPPYTASAGDLHVMVIDSSGLNPSDPTQTTIFANQLGLLRTAKPNTWLMLHHPFWAIDSNDPETETLWTAWTQAGDATKAVSLLLTGHIHILEALSFTDNGVPQLVVGNGGTSMDKPSTEGAGFVIGPRTVKSVAWDADFGFIAATPAANGWTLDLRDKNGQSKAKCALTATSLVCD